LTTDCCLQTEASAYLLSGSVEIINLSNCNVYLNKLTSTSLCAGPFNVNGCESDDGGPLICNNVLSALIDYRMPGYCDVLYSNLYGTYNSLASFKAWITENLSGITAATTTTTTDSSLTTFDSTDPTTTATDSSQRMFLSLIALSLVGLLLASR